MALDIFFLVVTGIVAYHGLTWRDEEGESDFVRLFNQHPKLHRALVRLAEPV